MKVLGLSGWGYIGMGVAMEMKFWEKGEVSNLYIGAST